MNSHLLNPAFIRQFFPQDEDGDLVSLAFYFGFWFPDGYRVEPRKRAAQVAADYWRLCGQHLRWMTTPMKLLWQAVPEDYTMDQWLSAHPAEDWVWQMIFHSGRTQREAASYQILGLGDSTQVYAYSHLFLSVPATWFADHPGQEPIALYLRWSQMLQARHGTAGLGLMPPADTPRRGKGAHLAAAFGKHFPGAERVDSVGNQNVFWGLLSANWLNMINTECVQQLGGIDTLRGHLAAEPLGHLVGLHPFDGGLILSSGDAPQLCEDQQPDTPPRAYGPVARLLKPLRTTKPGAAWGTLGGQSLAWLARFD